MVNYRWVVVFFGSMVFVFMVCDLMELLEFIDGDFVFCLEGNFDSIVFELVVGVDNYFMFIELFFINDGNLQLLSCLEELDCFMDCVFGWQFEFSGSIVVLDSLLGVGQVLFIQFGIIIIDMIYMFNFIVNFSYFVGVLAFSYEWVFYDGFVVGIFIVEKEILGLGIYEVEFIIIIEGDC